MQNSSSAQPPAPDKPRSRGRPRAFDRELALAAAMRVFWQKGYEATSISDLTEALGIGATSLYAAFGSKDALYTEALNHYGETNAHLVWGGFDVAATAREAVACFLHDSARALTGAVVDIPRGCMVTLATVANDAHDKLGQLMRSARGQTLEKLTERLHQAVREREIPPSTDLHVLARFAQTVQAGMSILARDGASTAELEEVAALTMLGWNARIEQAQTTSL